MNDHQANVTIHAALELAVKLRDETGPAITDAAQRVLDSAGGNAVAAVCVVAALVRVDQPVDRWWQDGQQAALFGDPLALIEGIAS